MRDERERDVFLDFFYSLTVPGGGRGGGGGGGEVVAWWEGRRGGGKKLSGSSSLSTGRFPSLPSSSHSSLLAIYMCTSECCVCFVRVGVIFVCLAKSQARRVEEGNV